MAPVEHSIIELPSNLGRRPSDDKEHHQVSVFCPCRGWPGLFPDPLAIADLGHPAGDSFNIDLVHCADLSSLQIWGDELASAVPGFGSSKRGGFSSLAAAYWVVYSAMCCLNSRRRYVDRVVPRSRCI